MAFAAGTGEAGGAHGGGHGDEHAIDVGGAVGGEEEAEGLRAGGAEPAEVEAGPGVGAVGAEVAQGEGAGAVLKVSADDGAAGLGVGTWARMASKASRSQGLPPLMMRLSLLFSRPQRSANSSCEIGGGPDRNASNGLAICFMPSLYLGRPAKQQRIGGGGDHVVKCAP